MLLLLGQCAIDENRIIIGRFALHSFYFMCLMCCSMQLRCGIFFFSHSLYVIYSHVQSVPLITSNNLIFTSFRVLFHSLSLLYTHTKSHSHMQTIANIVFLSFFFFFLLSHLVSKQTDIHPTK